MAEIKYCPVCGRPWDGTHQRDQRGLMRQAMAKMLEAQNFNRVERRELAAGSVSAIVAAGATYEKREPSRAANVPGDVIVPLAQSFITGCVGGTVGWLIGGPGPGIVAGGLTFSGAWLVLLADHRRLLWTIERITGKDLDNDNNIGEPGRPDPPIILRAPGEIKRDAADEVPMVTRDVSSPNRKLARDLAEFLTSGHQDGFTIRDWTGRTLSSGTIVSDGKWREWTALLRDVGILQSDQSGTRLVEGLSLDDALKCIIAGVK